MRPIRVVLAAPVLVLALVVSGCSGDGADTESDGGKTDTSSQASEPALEGELVEHTLISAVAPEGWEVDESTAEEWGIVLRQVLPEDSEAEEMTWLFRYWKDVSLDMEGAATTAEMDRDYAIEKQGGTDAGTIEVDGMTLFAVDMGDGRFEYFGQTEPDEEFNFHVAQFSLNHAVDQAAQEQAAELLKGVDFKS